VDPHIKRDTEYAVYSSGKDEAVYVNDRDGMYCCSSNITLVARCDGADISQTRD